MLQNFWKKIDIPIDFFYCICLTQIGISYPKKMPYFVKNQHFDDLTGYQLTDIRPTLPVFLSSPACSTKHVRKKSVSDNRGIILFHDNGRLQYDEQTIHSI